MARSLLVGLLVACGLTAVAEEPNSDAKKPPYERLLQGDDAEKAAELEQQIDEAVQADQYDRAIKLSEVVLALRTKLQGTDHWETVNAKWEADALAKVAKLSAQKRAGWLGLFHQIREAQQLEAKGQYAKAQILYENCCAWFEEVFRQRHPKTATGYNLLASNLGDQGKFHDAQVLHQKALHLSRELLGEWHPDTAANYNQLALNLKHQGMYTLAQPLYQKVLELRLGLHGEKHPLVAQSCNNSAMNLIALGRYADAQPLLQKALNLRQELLGEQHADTATCYQNLAIILNGQGKYADAQPLYEKACELRFKLYGEKHALTATSYNNLAFNYQSQRMFAHAQKLFQKALDLRLELYGENHHLTANSYHNLGFSLAFQRRYAEAQPLIQKALDLNRELLGEKHPDTATSYCNVATNLLFQGMYADAQPQLEKALERIRELLGDNHPFTALFYSSLAVNLHAQERYAEAQVQLIRAATAYESARLGIANQGLDRAIFGAEQSPYRVLAAIHARFGAETAAWDAAEADLARGLSDQLASQRHAILTPDEQKLRASLSARLLQLQAPIVQILSKREPTDAAQDELSMLQAERRKVEVKLSELDVALSRRTLAPLAEVKAAIPEGAALILWVDSEAKSARGQEHWGCVIRRIGEPRWERLRGTGPETSWTNDDSALPAKLGEALAAKHPSSASDITALARRLHAQRLAPLQKHLKGIKTLYVVPVNAMAGIPVEVLTQDYTVSYVPSGTFLAYLKNQAPSAHSGLLALGDPSFSNPHAKPIAEKPLPPGGLLITLIAPDGAAAKARLRPGDVLVSYGGVALDSLDKLTEAMNAQAKAKDVPITVWRDGEPSLLSRMVSSGRLGVALEKEPARDAVTNQRKTDAMLAKLRGGNWKDLPGTRAEVVQIAGLFGRNATTVFDSAASEQSLDDLRKKGELSKFRYLHLATHGEANNVKAFESVLILAQDKLPKDILPRVGEPLLNGQLSANEVLEFWKLNAELVTLSACETAIGRQGGGDGMLGFAQAFLLAGSRSVCLSLWKVDDAATALLMTRFYQNLLGKRDGLKGPMPKALALAEAKRWLRELSAEEALKLTAAATNGVVRGGRGKDEDLKLVVPDIDPKQSPAKDVKPFAHPRFWSAFILIGDPN